jgi:transposase InsO family protein
MSSANPLWGSPRIVGELEKIGIKVVKSTVEKYMIRKRGPSSPTWKAFLRNHVSDLVSVDFCVVPTAPFRILFVFVVLATERRRVVHFNVTANPTANWTARQITQAFPWDSAPRFLLRDRDSIYGEHFHQAVHNLGIREVLTAHRSPWQNPYVERLIGTIRRECLDHIIVFKATKPFPGLDSPLTLRPHPAHDLVPDALVTPFVLIVPALGAAPALLPLSGVSQVVVSQLGRVFGHYAG